MQHIGRLHMYSHMLKMMLLARTLKKKQPSATISDVEVLQSLETMEEVIMLTKRPSQRRQLHSRLHAAAHNLHRLPGP